MNSLRDEDGAAMVEMTIVIPLLLVLVLGFIDFGYAFYQWNAAAKAVQVGARLAAISDPVPTNLLNETIAAPTAVDIGLSVPAGRYSYACTAAVDGTASCTCTATTTNVCSNTANQASLNRILDGDTNRPGMRRFFPDLQPNQVLLEYQASGLGYWTRTTGPVPTIRVSIINHPFQFFFLGGLLGFANITMPSMISTVTGEDLSSAAPL